MAELERRYVVFKLKDIEPLPQRVKDALFVVESAVQQARHERGADPDMPCLVVEKDWPEYAPTLAAILARARAAGPTTPVPPVSEGEEAWRQWGRDQAAWPAHWDGRDKVAFDSALGVSVDAGKTDRGQTLMEGNKG